MRLRETSARSPFDARDVHALVSAIDDIVDYAEQSADWVSLYRIEAPMEQGEQLADVLARAAGAVESALAALRGRRELNGHLVTIHQLENGIDACETAAHVLEGMTLR